MLKLTMNNAQPCRVNNRSDMYCEQSKRDIKVMPCPQIYNGRWYCYCYCEMWGRSFERYGGK
jgi:hypothetical protein